MKRWILVLVVLIVLVGGFLFFNLEEKADEEIFVPAVASIDDNGTEDESVDFDKYNYDFVDEEVKSILTGMIGGSGKTAFYLPKTGYINVSRGSKFGVAYALNNPVPSGENSFVFNWSASRETCGVGADVTQSWIERGGYSWGKIPKGWVDHMTVYFSFPENVSTCSVWYDFEILKDGEFYDSETLKFNLV